MIHIHFIGCQYIKSSYFFEHQIVMQSTESYLFALVCSFSYVFYIVVENIERPLYILRIMESTTIY
jgi:hypothetical protein